MDPLEQILDRMRRGEYIQARRMAEALTAMEETSTQDRATAAYLAAEAAYNLDDLHATIGLANRAASLATEIGDRELVGRALFRLLGAMTAAGQYTEAVDVGRLFVAGLRDEWPQLDEELAGKALCNLGMVYRAMRRDPESLQAYWQALSRFERANYKEGQIICRQQMAWLLVAGGELEEAEQHLQISAALITLDVPGYLTTHQLTGEALLYLEQRKFAEAWELTQEVLAPGRPDVTNANRAVGFYVAGMVCVETGQMSSAKMMLSMAREAAISSGMSMVINLVQRLDASIRSHKEG